VAASCKALERLLEEYPAELECQGEWNLEQLSEQHRSDSADDNAYIRLCEEHEGCLEYGDLSLLGQLHIYALISGDLRMLHDMMGGGCFLCSRNKGCLFATAVRGSH